ncbi:MAG: aspartate aminotransferase family protein [Chloroflexi bacterium]|nr:aspartate aminotransferase family protein [Chloroflexota bacterium]
MDERALFGRTARLAADYRAGLDERPVARPVDLDALRAALGGPLPEATTEPREVIERLAAAADPGLVASAGPRYFGFVVGSGHPAATAADWLTTAWNQNAGLYALSPAAAVAEEVAGRWLVELFGLPSGTSVGFPTGATMATFTALAAARDRVLRDVGWDVEEEGLVGAPPINVVVGAEAHVTIFASLQMLGLGRGARHVHRVAADGQGRMRPDALRATLAGLDGPTIVCAQSGNVNSGAFDPLPEIVAAVRGHGGWLHVDGAFGLWAAVAPARRHLVAGIELADSWTTDAHKWLNVPYDSGLVFVRDVAAHQVAMRLGAAYYVETGGAERDSYNWVPESSRRARGFAVWAALASLGRQGLAELIERDCTNASRMAEGLATEAGVAILNEVVLNQVLVRFLPNDPAAAPSPDPAADALTRDVIARVQADGTCWLGGTTWHDMTAMRVSVSGWQTTPADIDRSAEAILRCARAARDALDATVAPTR